MSAVWDNEVTPLLQTDARLNAVTLLEELQRRCPDQWELHRLKKAKARSENKAESRTAVTRKGKTP